MDKYQRKSRWYDEKKKSAKKKNNPYLVPEEMTNNTIDMIGGDEQVEYESKKQR